MDHNIDQGSKFLAPPPSSLVTDSEAAVPWYRQFWPWFLISLPASAVIAGIATIIIAMQNPDGLVVDNYYKAGLAINQKLTQDQTAADLRLSATANYNLAQQQLTVQLQGNIETLPQRLQLSLIHPTQARHDIQIPLLKQQQNYFYGGMLTSMPKARWHVVLQPEDQGWRLVGRLKLSNNELWQLTPKL